MGVSLLRNRVEITALTRGGNVDTLPAHGGAMLAGHRPRRLFMRPSRNSRPLTTAAFCTALVWAGFACRLAADETLVGLRDDVRTPSEQTDERKVHWADEEPESLDDPNSSYGEELGEEFVGEVLGWALLGAIIAPYYCPLECLGDTYTQPGYFAHYPYQYDVGYMLIDPVEAFGIEGPYEPYWWAARVRGEFGTGFDDLDWIGGRVQLDTRSRLGVESDFRYVREDLDARRDTLWLGDANVLYRFAQSESVQFRTGLGFNYLADEIGSDFGFNFTYAVDCQPVRPLAFAAELDLGTLGHATLVHVRTTAGITCGVSEAYIGYDLYDIGSTQVQGLVAGVQIWY